MTETSSSTQATETQAKKPLTKEQRQKKREAAKQAVDLLSQAYPKVFDLKEPKPLKIGIHEELAADGKVSKTKIRKALSAYVRHYNYIACLEEGVMRVDLKGEDIAPVTAEEAEHAKEKITAIEQAREERKQQFEARKKAQSRRKEKETRIKGKLDALVAKSTSGKNAS